MDDIRYDLVEICTTSPVLFTDAGKAPALTAKFEFYRPPTHMAPPYPAVLVSDGRGELKVSRERDYARHLAQHGYAVLVMDSFGARGLGGVAQATQIYGVTEAMMLADAFAGLAALTRRTDIAPQRIHHLGFSGGGLTALLSGFDQMRRAFGAGAAAFASHASCYGSQALRLVDYRSTRAPVTILYGGQDDTLNHARLDLLAGDLMSAGSTVRIIGYDTAYHAWDREAERPSVDRINLRKLAGRIDPDGHLSDDKSGRPVTSARARGLWLTRAASLVAVHKERNAAVTDVARTHLLQHFADADGNSVDGETAEPGERPKLRIIG